jgi:hypothetical protein
MEYLVLILIMKILTFNFVSFQFSLLCVFNFRVIDPVIISHILFFIFQTKVSLFLITCFINLHLEKLIGARNISITQDEESVL